MDLIFLQGFEYSKRTENPHLFKILTNSGRQIYCFKFALQTLSS